MYIFTRERLLFFLLFISVGVVNKMQAQVSGVVYKDFNMDGAKGTASPNLEVGMSGVVVNATKADGSSLTVTYTGGGTSTDKSGAYAVTGGTLGQIRLEFVMPDSYTFAAKGASGGTTVMFPSGASQNLAVNYPADYCGVTDPYLVTSCYVGNNASGINDVMVKYPYSASGASHNANHSTIALKDEIGSTWGIGYDRETQNIYTGAFVKRHIPLKDNNGDGKEDIGAIYKIPSSGSPSLWLDVTTLGVDVGMSLMPTIATRALPTPVTTSDLAASHDTDLYPLIGKIGLGDVEISDDNKQLFFVNLFDSKVYTVNLATKTLVGAGITVPNTCTGGNERPFALAFHRGKLYVGAVCDAATSKLDVDMKATVYRLDGTVLTSVLSFPLNYTKGAAFTWGGIYGNKWNPWEDSFTNISGGISPTGLNLVCEPQAMFADIVFDTDESLIMLFNDRLGHQTGTANYQPSASDTKLYYGLAGGDILRASLVSGVYTLEKNATSGGITTAGAGNGQGPGTPTATGYTSPSGEFYVGDDENSVHEEVVGGGAALLPGRGQVVTQVSDPAQNYFAGGTYWFNNTTGEYDQAYVVFKDPSFGQQPWLFGKANGLGDMELMCNNAPIEIGNRVWDDTDKDGIQDAGETGISGVNVKLYAANGTSLIATATTDAAGNYFFSSAIGTNTPSAIYGLSLSFNTSYQIEFPQSIAAKTITGSNLGTNDLLDSDANSSTGRVSFSTGYAGENNHSLDVGYSLCTVPTVGTPVATQATCNGSVANNDAKIDVTGISGGDKYSYGIDSTTFTFASATSFTGATINITGLANPSVATTYYVRIYNASETCYKTVSVILQPKSCTPICTKPAAGNDQIVCAGTSATLTGTSPTTGTWSAQAGNPTGSTLSTTSAGVATVTFAATASGTYKFIYNVGASCEDTMSIAVNAKPVIADGSGTICAGTSVDLTSKITGYASLLNRVWTVSTAGGTAVSTPTSVSPSSTTTYVLVAENAASCKDTANVVITVNAKPNAGSDQTLACANATTNTLTTATTLVPVTSGGTFTQIGTTPAVANIAGNAVSGMTVAGTYQFQYTVLGCLDTVSVTVNPCAGCVKPDAGADASAVCQPTSTSKLTVVTSGGTWSVQTGNPSAAAIDANGNITGLSAAGTYKFVYSVTGGGITCTDTAQVVVNAKPIIADGSGTICVGTSVDLTSKITGYGSLLNRVWTVSTAGGTAVSTPTSVSPSSTTTYVLVAENAAGCKDTANVVITVNAKPNAGTDQSPTCVGNTAITTATLAATAVAGGAWTQVATNPAGAVITTPSSATSTVTGLMPGVYQFIWTNSASCSDTIQIVIPDCSTICVKPNAGADLAQCLPKTSTNLTDATATTEWIAYSANPAPATIDATTGVIAGMTAVGTYKFILRTKGNATCADTMEVVVTVGDPAFALCNDGTTSYTLTADAGVTNVIWYNMAGVQVGTGSTLLVNSKTLGLEDGSEAFYYTALDTTGCSAESCCPIKFTTEQCCPVVPYCLPVGFKRN